MKILAIGNSFSQDATRYLSGVAKAGGVSMKVVNLYIGGCSLARHYKNMLTGERAYSLEFNGESTGFFVSLTEALVADEWDYITLQQASHYSGDYDTYQPYLDALSEYIRKYCPKSELVIHETWAYEEGCARLKEKAHYDDSESMYNDLHENYKRAAKAVGAKLIIPSGTLFKNLLAAGVPKIHRDTFHATKGLGRYALALVWFRTLTGKSVLTNDFDSFDEEISNTEIALAKECVEKL